MPQDPHTSERPGTSRLYRVLLTLALLLGLVALGWWAASVFGGF